MPITWLDEWAGHRGLLQTLPLQTLSNTALGIDASFYLDQHLNHYSHKEPLLPALGGFPFSLKQYIERELRVLRDNAVQPVFVFNGLESESRRKLSDRQNGPEERESAKRVEHAWELYAKGDALQVVEVFSSAGATKPEHLYKFLQRILEAEGIDYLVAPYAATAQLSYLYNGPKQFIDSIYGPTDLLLFKSIDKVIVRLDLKTSPSSSDLTPTFTYLTRASCQEELGRLTDDQFTEFALLLGSPFLHMFPAFESIALASPSASATSNNATKSPATSTQPTFNNKKVPTPTAATTTSSSSNGNGLVPSTSPPGLNVLSFYRDALSMFHTASRSALTLCSQFEDQTRSDEEQYSDLYKRAFMTIRHHVILNIDGRVTPLEADSHSSDLHEIIGQRLPEELYYYIYRGVIDGYKVPSWLTSGVIRLELPLGADDTPAYRDLVLNKLGGIRNTAVRLLSSSLHRFYQTKRLVIKPWWITGPEEDKKKGIAAASKGSGANAGEVTVVNLKDVPSMRESVSTWRVNKKALPDVMQNVGARNDSNWKLFGPALKAPENSTFATTSICPRDSELLTTPQEILSNVAWRFLQIRGYIDEKHNLTPWGRALVSALSSHPPPSDSSPREYEEAVFLGVELVRLGVLNSNNVLPGVPSGATMSEDDKKFTALISRAATIGKLRHQPIGYSGPLNRQTLAFRSQISAVRKTLRDLIEVV
ncbi:alpha mannosidase-like protein, partial [Ascosphaera pollenicola]